MFNLIKNCSLSVIQMCVVNMGFQYVYLYVESGGGKSQGKTILETLDILPLLKFGVRNQILCVE